MKYKEFVVCGNESGEIKGFKTIEEARNFIKELKKFDKKNNIQDIYYIEEIVWN